MCHHQNRPFPEFQVYLNDLPGNDFNTLFRSLPAFYEKFNKEEERDSGACFVAGVPGSFYGRLFPTRSLDFVHSSSSLHWLSQARSPFPFSSIFVLVDERRFCLSWKICEWR